MKLRLLSIVLLTSICLPAHAENVEHTQKLLSTKQCQNCDLSRAGLVFAQLSGANLSQANLVGANLSQANLVGANLTGTNLTGATLHGANLSGAILTGANLSGVDLRNAYLVDADLTGTRLDNALLQGAIGLSSNTGNALDFYRWGVEAGSKKQYERAIEHFNQALARQPDFAPAQLARGMARLELGDQSGAIQDLEQASTLFTRQGDTATAQSTQEVVTALKTPPKEPKNRGGNGLGTALLSTFGSLVKMFLLP
ncbi:pentapeptide repeat-containing protein [Myxacorys almedinensis]|uniref:Tetratricopeptide repeat protein n=1 Tax=Myxacorys almedinensis A TaxID=2690445 RepID=A0A8J8CM65_9CYAN|nr:pentapeptide repeat-containing protein [Myxacorys almedinensis]NDJ16922.1 tetratricopeptide repeat protein [Myxacorys almedinensis A]